MPQMIVRNIPDSVMRELRQAAKDRGTSVESLVRDTLAQFANRRRQWADFARWSEEFVARQRGRRWTGPTAAEMIREDRER